MGKADKLSAADRAAARASLMRVAGTFAEPATGEPKAQPAVAAASRDPADHDTPKGRLVRAATAYAAAEDARREAQHVANRAMSDRIEAARWYRQIDKGTTLDADLVAAARAMANAVVAEHFAIEAVKVADAMLTVAADALADCEDDLVEVEAAAAIADAEAGPADAAKGEG